jgi:hypothetical protein
MFHVSARSVLFVDPICLLERDTCHPWPFYVIAHRTCLPSQVIGEVTGTPGVRDFKTSEYLGCSEIEGPKRPEGRNHVAGLRDFENPEDLVCKK